MRSQFKPRQRIGLPAPLRWVGAALAAIAVGCLVGTAAFGPAQAAVTSVVGSPLLGGPAAPGANDQMLLEADQLIYDYNRDSIAASGRVKIYYNGYALEAQRVTYNRKTGRLVASGAVRVLEPGGAVISAETLDVTDSFRDGFVKSLRIDTADRTHFAAASASRQSGSTTVLDRAVYTACQPCIDHPERPPLWQVKAARIVVDQSSHLITFNDASLEFLGVPVAWVPFFWTPDDTVKRQSGFLSPRTGFSKELGIQVGTPYFWALAPNYDLTITPTLLSKQGALVDVEWRHRLSNGTYTVEAAGLRQERGELFLGDGGTGTFAQRDFRGGVRTTGLFALADQWSYGWDATALTDRTFTRNYNVISDENAILTSRAYLTGQSDRNRLDARAYYFAVLTDKTDPIYDQERQPIVHPVVDHRYTLDQPVAGGELTVRSNITSLSRGASDTLDLDGNLLPDHYRGVSGAFTRLSNQIEWQKGFVAPGGMLFTPFAYARGDSFHLSATDPAAFAAGLTTDNSVLRAMPAVGLEWRWPWMALAGGASHVLEPIAQLIGRPNEQRAGKLPNEDAQSLVFDDTTLFRRDKFSGYDRVEGGTRLNAGVRYVGYFPSGMTIDGLVGQSYQLAGVNPFATPDIANTGAFSGLQTQRSDIVSRIALADQNGHSLTARGRFAESDFTLNRGELEAAGPMGPVTAAVSLAYLRNLAATNGEEDSFVVRGAATSRVFDDLRLFGSVVYDIRSAALVGDSLGIAYDNDCVSLSLAFNETRNDYSDIVASRQIWLRLDLRTLGAATTGVDLNSVAY
ncbi:MAG: LPS-assembly protein LptD [Bauldia sp.]